MHTTHSLPVQSTVKHAASRKKKPPPQPWEEASVPTACLDPMTTLRLFAGPVPVPCASSHHLPQTGPHALVSSPLQHFAKTGRLKRGRGGAPKPRPSAFAPKSPPLPPLAPPKHVGQSACGTCIVGSRVFSSCSVASPLQPSRCFQAAWVQSCVRHLMLGINGVIRCTLGSYHRGSFAALPRHCGFSCRPRLLCCILGSYRRGFFAALLRHCGFSCRSRLLPLHSTVVL